VTAVVLIVGVVVAIVMLVVWAAVLDAMWRFDYITDPDKKHRGTR